MARGNKPHSREESEKMKKKEAQTNALEATAHEKNSVTSLGATRAAVAQSSQFSSGNKISISEQFIPSHKTKLSEHSKEVQAKRHAQK